VYADADRWLRSAVAAARLEATDPARAADERETAERARAALVAAERRRAGPVEEGAAAP
jgi:hypothetical protein